MAEDFCWALIWMQAVLFGTDLLRAVIHNDDLRESKNKGFHLLAVVYVAIIIVFWFN